MSAVLAVAASNDGANPADRLVHALRLHGFENVSADQQGDMGTDDTRPQIPVIRFSGNDKAEVEGLQSRLTDLVLRFYDVHEDGQEPDTQLAVLDGEDQPDAAFDQTVDRDVEFDFELSFDGLESLVKMPRELFALSPDFGRSILERYCSKLDRFAAFLESPQALAFTSGAH